MHPHNAHELMDWTTHAQAQHVKDCQIDSVMIHIATYNIQAKEQRFVMITVGLIQACRSYYN